MGIKPNGVSGLDATPIVVPIQEFGREHHRSLPSLPQQPNIRSAPKKRLVMSWWDRELSIWRIEKYRKEQLGRATSPSVYKPPGRKLVAKIAIQVRAVPNPNS